MKRGMQLTVRVVPWVKSERKKIWESELGELEEILAGGPSMRHDKIRREGTEPGCSKWG